jgi:RimJ/RimL family protein N-acetyltransferase
LHCIDADNVASQAVARKLGAKQECETILLGHACDLWVSYRSRA